MITPNRTSARKVAVVTGSSSGIGLATARLLAKHGYQVVGFSRSATTVPDVLAVNVDVRDTNSVEQGVQGVLSAHGRIDALVNAAGFSIVGAIEESSIEQAKALFETNVFGIVRVTRAVLPTMRAQRAGRIVNLSSVVGFLPAPFMGLYAATKHAVEGYTESLDHEVRTLGIRAVVVEPGFTRTRIGHNSLRADNRIDDYRLAADRAYDLIGRSVQAGMEPEVVGQCVLDALESTHPRLRYPAGPRDRLLSRLRRFVPPAMFDRSLRKQFQLDAS